MRCLRNERTAVVDAAPGIPGDRVPGDTQTLMTIASPCASPPQIDATP